MYHESFDCVPSGFHHGLLLESDRSSGRELATLDSDRTGDPDPEVSI
ncbi:MULTISPECIES: hypothetical protein [unclassified Natronococcus]|nr:MULTISPECIES: hypothetical protein [unclassified Natronococcus]MDG5818230.1 hypothetical protein [Natronococcus sp. A-GB7]